MNSDNHTTSMKEKILTINVKPGWKEGTKITFPNEGDQGPNIIPGTLHYMNSYYLSYVHTFILLAEKKCYSICPMHVFHSRHHF